MNNINLLQSWFLENQYGQYLLEKEIAFYKKNIENVYGLFCLQTYFDKINYSIYSNIANKYVLNNNIKFDHNNFPFKDNSIDLIICPHLLGLTSDYQNLLNECQRVIVPNGKLIITSFSKNIFLNTCTRKTFNYNLIDINVLKSQLEQFNFKIINGEFFCYNPSFNIRKKIINSTTVDSIGNRWFPTLSSSFGIVAVKCMIPLNNIFVDDIKTNTQLIPNLISASKIYNQHYLYS